MKTFHAAPFLVLAGILACPAVPMLAQAAAPIPPPISSDPAPSPPTAKNPDSDLAVSTNTAGQPAVPGSVKALRFSAVDANADGRISLSEFVTFIDAGNQPRSSDSNRGGISPSEMLFHRMDRNNDDFLSETEVTAYQDELDRNEMKR